MHTHHCGTMGRRQRRGPAELSLLGAKPNPELEDPAMTDSIGPTLATAAEAPPITPPGDHTNRCARDVRRLAGHLVADELHDLVAGLLAEDDGVRVHAVLAELVRETARSLDGFIRQGRMPRRADLYSFRALAALAGATDFHEPELIAVVEACADEVRDLWLAHITGLAYLHTAAAVETASELVREVARLFLRKLPGQVRIGLAIAELTRQTSPAVAA